MASPLVDMSGCGVSRERDRKDGTHDKVAAGSIEILARFLRRRLRAVCARVWVCLWLATNLGLTDRLLKWGMRSKQGHLFPSSSAKAP